MKRLRSTLAPVSSALVRCIGSTSGLLNRCESVIERAFAAGFLVHGGFSVKSAGDCWAVTREGGETLALRAQYEVTLASDPWARGVDPEKVFARPDFAFFRDDRLLLLVDVDGHDFHERSREQVRHDRERDRHLLRCGLRVARFTGSEINTDARGCAAEAFALATLGGSPS